MIAANSSKRRALKLGTALATCIACVVTANAAFGQAITDLPTGGNVVTFPMGIPANPATITYNTPDRNLATIVTVDAKASSQIINWNTFSIANGNSANFISTNADDSVSGTAITVVNRVVGVPPGRKDGTGRDFYASLISGNLNASNNISIWLVNPAGITFGPSGTFSGGSLILSALDFEADPTGLLSGASSVAFKPHNFPNNPNKNDDEAFATTTGNGGNAQTAEKFELKLSANADSTAIAPKGSLLLVGRKIVTERDISATGTVAFVAANKVSFADGVNSPMTYSITEGTTLSGIEIASGTVAGKHIVAAAVSKQGAQNALLQVGAAAKLVATSNNGTILLTTVPVDTQNPNTPGGDGIVSSGMLLSGKDPLDTSGNTLLSGIDVTVASDGKAVVAGAVTATGDYTVRGTQVTLGTDTGPRVSQKADGNVSITSANGTITGETKLDLQSNALGSATLPGQNALLLDAGAGTIAFKAGSNLNSGTGTNAAAIGLRFGKANDLSLGNATGAVVGIYDAATSAFTAVLGDTAVTADYTGNFSADAITTDQDFTAKFAKNIAVNSITVNNGKAIALTAGGNIGGRVAGTGIDLTSKPVDPMAMPLIKGDIALTAGKTGGGIITVGTADARNLSATAGDNVGDPMTGKGGEIGIGTATLTGDLNVSTYYANPAQGEPNGDVRLGKIDVGGSAKVFTTRLVDPLNLVPAPFGSGDIVITEHLIAKGNVTLTTNNLGDLLVANYVAGTTTTTAVGLIESTAGTISVTTGGSVLALNVAQMTAATPFDLNGHTGLGAISAEGDLTVTANGDLAINALSAGGALGVTVTDGSIYGRNDQGTSVQGGAFVASATAPLAPNAGNIAIATGSGKTINASLIEATGTVKLDSASIAVGTLTTAAPAVAFDPAADVVDYMKSYVDLRKFTGPTPVTVAFTSAATPLPATNPVTRDKFFPAYGATDLTGKGVILAAANGAAQLGTVTSTLGAKIDARGIVAAKVDAKGAANLTATIGTLAVGELLAGSAMLEKKTAPPVVPAPVPPIVESFNDLRLGTDTPGSTSTVVDNVTLLSATSVRVTSLTSNKGNIALTASNGDISGLLVPAKPADTALATYATAPQLSDNYGKAALTAKAVAASITVNAALGGAQLGTVEQGTDADANTLADASAGISITAKSISATSLVSKSRNVYASASDGTLVLGTVEALGWADLIKLKNASSDGNSLRFGAVTAHGKMADPAALIAATIAARIISATSVVGTGPLAGDVTTDAGAIRVNAPGLIQLDVVSAKGDVSIEAGSNGLMLPRSGQIMLATAASTDGAVRLTSVNDTTPLATGIRFSAITAKTDVELITAGDLGARIVGGSINETGGSSGHVYADSATAISLNTASAGTDIGLSAATNIGAGTLTAGGSIAGDAGGSISVRTSTANGGDIGYRATSTINLDSATARRSIYAKTMNGDIVVGIARANVVGSPSANGGDLLLDAGRDVFLTDGQAAGDVRLIGESVRVDKAKALGTVLPGGFGVPGFGLIAFSDPLGTGIVGRAPSFGFGAYGGLNGSIVITARNGDVTGLLTGQGTPALLARVTKSDKLSTANGAIDAFKASTLDARQDIVVTAEVKPADPPSLVGGGVQLGTITAGRDISVTGDAVTIANAAAGVDATAGMVALPKLGPGNLTVIARIGTLAVETGSARLTATLDKRLGSSLTDGDDLRVGMLTAGTDPTAPAALTGGKSVDLISSTSIRLDKVTGATGNVTIAAAAGDVTGRRDRMAVPDSPTAPYLTLSRVKNEALLTNAYSSTTGKGDVTASTGSLTITAAQPDVMRTTGGVVQLNDVTAGTDLVVTANAISLRDATATNGLLTLTATDGTLVLRDALAKKKAKLVKQDKQSDPLAKTGNEIRFNTVTGGSSGDDPVGVELTSSTHVRGIGATATAGNIAIGAGDIDGKTVRAGEVTGRSGGRLVLDATLGGIRVNSGALARLGPLTADGDIAVSAGSPLVIRTDGRFEAVDPAMAGAIDLTTATSNGGNISLVTRNYRPGSLNGVTFDALHAAGNIQLLTSGNDAQLPPRGNGGDVRGTSIDARGFVYAGANDVAVSDHIMAGGDIRLTAVRSILGGTFTSGGNVLGQAGTTVTVTTVHANGGDAAFMAGGAIDIGLIDAFDDLSLVGGSVTVGKAEAFGRAPEGTGADLRDPDFTNRMFFFDPIYNLLGTPENGAFGGPVPGIKAAQGTLGGNLTLQATVGDVTVKTSAKSQADLIVDAKLAANLGTLTSGKSMAINAGTAVGGFATAKAGVLTAGEDIGILAGTTIKLSDATAGDDLTARALGALAGNITADALKSTAVGGKDRSVSFSSVSPTVAFVAEKTELADSNVSLETTGGRIEVVTVQAQRLLAQAKTGFTATGAITTGFPVPGGAALPADTTLTTAKIVVTNGDIRFTTITAANADHDVALQASGAIRGGGISAGRSIAGTAGGAIDIASSGAGADIGYTAGSTANLGEATAGGNYSVNAVSDITLGRDVANAAPLTVHTAGGSVTIASSGGSIREGTTAGVKLTANNDGSGSEALVLDAKGDNVTKGDIALANAILTAGNGTSTSDALLTATGAVTFDKLVADNNATIGKATGGTDPTSLTATGITATKGSISGTAGTIDVASSTAGISIGYTAGTTASLGEADAMNGSYTVTAGGAITLGRTGKTVHKAAGAVTITSTGAGIAKDVDGLAITSNSDGAGSEMLSLDAAVDIALAKATLKAGTGASLSNALLTAKGAVTFDTLIAENNATIVAASGSTAPSSLTANSITASKGSISGTAGSPSANPGTIDVASSKARINIGYEATSTAKLGEATAETGNYNVKAGGQITLGRTGRTVHQAAGQVTINSTGAGIAKDVDELIVTANSDGIGIEALTMTAKADIALANATLNGGTNKQSPVSLTTTAGSIIVKTVNGAAVMLDAKTAGDVTVTRISASGEVKLSAKKTVRVGSDGVFAAVPGDGIAAAGQTVSLTAADAVIDADVNATSIRVVDDAAAGNALLIGQTGAGFSLTDTELGRLKATSTLTLDAGTGTGVIAQNVRIGKVNLSTPVTVNVLAKGTRIDLSDKLSTSGNVKTLVLGGDGGSALASVIYIAQTPGGDGGQIFAPTAEVKLNAGNIAAGSKLGFADALGVVSGTGDATVAKELNDSGGSTLYFAGNGGVPYGSNVKLLTAKKLTVTYSGFALFQNTGAPPLTSGVDLADLPTAVPSLDLSNSGITPVFGLFGTINGLMGSAAAINASGYTVRYNNIGSTRINGCVVNGGGNCLAVQTITPTLAGMDSIRGNIFFVNPDFELPFDPLIGTSNDSLIGDVGSFGLGDVPMTPIECSDPKGKCPAQKKDGN